jgi:hypothetical protein
MHSLGSHVFIGVFFFVTLVRGIAHLRHHVLLHARNHHGDTPERGVILQLSICASGAVDAQRTAWQIEMLTNKQIGVLRGLLNMQVRHLSLIMPDVAILVITPRWLFAALPDDLRDLLWGVFYSDDLLALGFHADRQSLSSCAASTWRHSTKGFCFETWVEKLVALRHSPFVYTLYLDLDARVCTSSARAFEAAVFNELRRNSEVVWQLAPTPFGGGSLRAVPTSFVERNCGVFAIRQGSRLVEAAWLALRRQACHERVNHDQAAWREAAYTLSLNETTPLREFIMPPTVFCRFGDARCVTSQRDAGAEPTCLVVHHANSFSAHF